MLEQLIHIMEHVSKEDKPLVYTTEKAAKVLEICVPTLRDHFLCRSDFPKVWAGKKCLIPRSALEEWLKQKGFE